MSPRILVVDGHPVQGQTVRSLLKWMGLQVVGVAADGAAALRLAHELYADVVVLSLTRPLVPCFDTARALARAVPSRGVILVAFETTSWSRPSRPGSGATCSAPASRRSCPRPFARSAVAAATAAPPSRRPTSCLAATTRRSRPCPGPRSGDRSSRVLRS